MPMNEQRMNAKPMSARPESDRDKRPTELNLSNWRQAPLSRWAFHHVCEIVPSEAINRGDQSTRFEHNPAAQIDDLSFIGPNAENWSLSQWRQASETDALLVTHKGQLVHEWYADDRIELNPHIIFSISKSVTATLAGVLVERGMIDPQQLITELMPELSATGYAGASLQQLLDMQVSIDFDEDYLASSGAFVEYRSATGWHPCGVDQIDSNLHDFLSTIKPGKQQHGFRFEYKSPNSDLLGWLLERASGQGLAELMSEHLWQPMGAEKDAYITVDRKGAPRSAGGLCVIPRDLMRFAEMVRCAGVADQQQVIPTSWINDCMTNGSREAWLRGESAREFPQGCYRNKWYQTGNDHSVVMAIGIHSQWIYIDPVAEVSIVKLSSQGDPLNLELDTINLQAFARVCAELYSPS